MATTTNLYIDQGADFAETVIVKDLQGNVVDLTGASLRSEARHSFTTATAYPFTITVVDAVNGVVTLSMTNEQTTTMRAGRYVYDGLIQIGAVISRFIQGLATVSPSVTQ
jgi:hypothetical protein